MNPGERPVDFHPQDWILIVEALVQWAGPPEETGPKEERAYELIEAIARLEGLPPSDLLLQIDDIGVHEDRRYHQG